MDFGEDTEWVYNLENIEKEKVEIVNVYIFEWYSHEKWLVRESE